MPPLARAGVLVALVLALAGCLSDPLPLQDAEAAHAGSSCPGAQAVVAFNASGAPQCAAPALAGHSCEKGEVVTGFGAGGMPTCRSIYEVAMEVEPPASQQRAESTGKEAVQEVSSNLKVVAIYGVRNASDAPVGQLKLMVELSAGAVPMDLGRLIIRYSDGETTQNHQHASGPDVTERTPTFATTWIRGEEEQQPVMESGDLVEIAFAVPDLPPRRDVQLALIPETGSPVAADFRTPATYGGDTVITLR